MRDRRVAIVDIEKERTRLSGQRDKLIKGVEGTRKKLSNENFISRAKPEVVEREKVRLGDLEAQLETVKGLLESLG